MRRIILRLDDACERIDESNWNKIEEICDKYDIKPLVGIIPNCKDVEMNKYNFNDTFWSLRVNRWITKGWTIAMHGLNHYFKTNESGINPVNKKSEFAGLSLNEQRQMINEGLKIFESHGVVPYVFFAPAHTFDNNTIDALSETKVITHISDTPAFDIYQAKGLTFVPQQSGIVRKLPFRTITFCYHPNTMKEEDFLKLERFAKKNHFSDFPREIATRKLNLVDKLLMKVYYARKRKK